MIVGSETLFVADTRAAGPGRLTAEFESLNGVIFPTKIESQENNVHLITVIPPTPGEYRLNVLLNKLHVPGSPLHFNAINFEEHFENKKLIQPTPSPRFVAHENELTQQNTHNMFLTNVSFY